MPDPYQPLPEPAGGDWRARALCAQIDGDMFFPDTGESTAVPKAICARCPVRAECLETALTNNERFGVWGGLTPNQRRDLTQGSRRRERNHCNRGHDLTRVGRRSNGRCTQCAREWDRNYKKRRPRIAVQNQHTATNTVNVVHRDGQNGTEPTRGQNVMEES